MQRVGKVVSWRLCFTFDAITIHVTLHIIHAIPPIDLLVGPWEVVTTVVKIRNEKYIYFYYHIWVLFSRNGKMQKLQLLNYVFRLEMQMEKFFTSTTISMVLAIQVKLSTLKHRVDEPDSHFCDEEWLHGNSRSYLSICLFCSHSLLIHFVSKNFKIFTFSACRHLSAKKQKMLSTKSTSISFAMIVTDQSAQLFTDKSAQ